MGSRSSLIAPIATLTAGTGILLSSPACAAIGQSENPASLFQDTPFPPFHSLCRTLLRNE